MDLNQLRSVRIDHDQGVLVAYYVDGSHSIWHPRPSATEHGLSIHVVSCDPGLPCQHDSPRVGDKRKASGETGDKRKASRETGLSPNVLAERMFKKFEHNLAHVFSMAPESESQGLKLEAELSAHKENFSGLHSHSRLLEKYKDKADQNRVFLAVLEHQLRCADICQEGWSNLSHHDLKEAEKVDWRHRILSAVLKRMRSQGKHDEPLALSILVALADSNYEYSNLKRSGKEKVAKTIDLFAARALAVAEEQQRKSSQLWYMHPVKFVAWLLNKPPEECRQSLYLEDLDLAGCEPDEAVQCSGPRLLEDKATPTPRLTNAAPLVDHDHPNQPGNRPAAVSPNLACDYDALAFAHTPLIPAGATEPENVLLSPVSQMVAASQSRGNKQHRDQELSMWGSSVPQPSQDRSPDASSSRDAPSDEGADFSTQVLLPMEEVWRNLGGLENVAPVDLEGMLFTPADYERLGLTANFPIDPCFNQRAE